MTADEDAEGRPAIVTWEGDGPPKSTLYGDVYFSRDGGLAETRTVFLAGCGMPGAWRGRNRFVVGELGFGTGLNIAALLMLWRETCEPGATLQIFTIEAHPLTATEAARALAFWPELEPAASALLRRWPGRARGFHRIDLPEWHAIVDLAVMEAGDALNSWQGAADAWFLDGFSPALNPEIWRDEVLRRVGERSAPGARAATYTVAGGVRRGLAAAGFHVERAPGHGRKRERLEARWPGVAVEARRPRTAVIGAGIAGAAVSRALRALGAEVEVFDAEGPGAGASGAPAALMAPRLDAGLGPAAALFAQGARRAAQLYLSTPGAVLALGARQKPVGMKDPVRFAAIAASHLFEPGRMRLEDDSHSLLMEDALTVDPAAILRAWLGDTAKQRVSALQAHGGAWRLQNAAGDTLTEVEAVCVCAGPISGALLPEIELTPVRGQATLAKDIRIERAELFGAYAIATGDGVMLGATHDRDDVSAEPRAEDRLRNLRAIAATLPDLAERAAASPLTDWVAIRATTRDYFPLAGRVFGGGPGLHVLTGLGSRGFCLAPLLGEHLAAILLGVASPLPSPLASLVDPARFSAREARKGRPRR